MEILKPGTRVRVKAAAFKMSIRGKVGTVKNLSAMGLELKEPIYWVEMDEDRDGRTNKLELLHADTMIYPLRDADVVCYPCAEGYCSDCKAAAGEWDRCDCEGCAADRLARREAAEFFNGLEDFFKSIDPERIGWDAIEEAADAFDAGDLVQ